MTLRLSDAKPVFHCPIFDVLEQRCTTDGGNTLQVYTMKIAPWVNVVPITSDGKVLLVEQLRFGTNAPCLETPGGAVEAHERDLTLAAVRELEEETGFTSQRILALPSFEPNPALQDNRITFFLAFDAQPLERNTHPKDPFEEIRVHAIPFDEAIAMVRTGQISHSLAALGLLLAEPYVKARNSAPR